MEEKFALLEARLSHFERKLAEFQEYTGSRAHRSSSGDVERLGTVSGLSSEDDHYRQNTIKRRLARFAADEGQPDAVLAEILLIACELRRKHFEKDLFFDPVWLMLLDLYLAEAKGNRIAVSSLCLASGVADTTALRYLNLMEQRKLVERVPDTADKRRCFVVLTEKSRSAIRQYLKQIQPILKAVA